MKLVPRRKQRGISSLLRNLGLFVMRGIRANARDIYPLAHNKINLNSRFLSTISKKDLNNPHFRQSYLGSNI
jgi:hypothetical protein